MPEPINEFDIVALLHDLPEHQLPAGQTGAVVFVHDGGNAFDVEFTISPRQSVVATVQGKMLLKLKGLAGGRPTFGAGEGMLKVLVEDDEHLKDFDEYMR
jgi:hypothetical protein